MPAVSLLGLTPPAMVSLTLIDLNTGGDGGVLAVPSTLIGPATASGMAIGARYANVALAATDAASEHLTVRQSSLRPSAAVSWRVFSQRRTS
jgi:hypothetical protein